MTMTDLQDLLDTVEQMRQRMHPELDSGFLEAVVQAEHDFPDDNESALNVIEAAMRQALERSDA